MIFSIRWKKTTKQIRERFFIELCFDHLYPHCFMKTFEDEPPHCMFRTYRYKRCRISILCVHTHTNTHTHTYIYIYTTVNHSQKNPLNGHVRLLWLLGCCCCLRHCSMVYKMVLGISLQLLWSSVIYIFRK